MSKRARSGTGSIYKRSSDGRWVGSIRWIEEKSFQEQGSPNRRTVYGATRREVEGKLREIRGFIDAGSPVVEAADKVETVVEYWVSHVLESSAKRSTTISRDRTILRTKVIAYLGAERLQGLSEVVVSQWYRRMVDDGVSPATITKASTLLAVVLDDAVDRKLVRSHVLRKVTRPSLERHEADYYTSTEIAALIGAAEGSREAPLLTLAAFTGCRVGELLGLRWKDVRLDAEEFAVTGTLVRTNGSLRRHEPKTKAGVRVVPLPMAAVEALKLARRQQDSDREASQWWTDSGFVLTTSAGEPIDPSNARRWLGKVKKQANIQRGSWHSFRHSYASQLLASGTSMVTVSRVLGHSRIAVTIDTYGHLERTRVADEIRAGLQGYATIEETTSNVVALRVV